MPRCVEIKKLDDWRHVDPEETDLVIYCEPFHDRVVIDDPRSRRELCDTFQSMQDSAKMPDKESRVDVVIVSEHSMVEAWKEHNDMQLFEDVVELYRPTAEETPLDVEKRYKSCKRRGAGDVLGNMLAYSDAYIKQWRTDEIDQALMDSAKEKFKKKALVITGPKGSGKTNFAVNLVSTCYEENQCVVLTETSEWKHVILGEVSVIIIDEFAGKFKYNASTTEGWLNKFDLIYAAVVQGKVNVIVTCETTRFKKVLKTYSGHALLNHRIQMPGRGTGNITVKEEPLSPFSDSSDTPEMDEAVVTYSREDKREAPGRNVKENLPEYRSIRDINIDIALFDYCEMPDGTVVCIGYSRADVLKEYITKLNLRNCTMEGPFKLDYQLNCISFPEGQEIIIFTQEKNKMQHATVNDSGIELGEIKNIPVNQGWKKVRVHGGKYIICTNVSVCIYDQTWKRIREITHDRDNNPLFYDTLPSSESKQSKNRHITDITTGEELFFVSSRVKIVVCNYDGDVTRVFRAEAKGIAVYSEQLLLTWSDHIVSVYSVTGVFKKMLLHENHMSSLFYSKKNKMLFLRKFDNEKIVCIEDSST
ncbi:uncharacterized protein LOC123526276 [Mercenaria mercenaria]|uniref:uncharacterized protein LOC123526276 n=1 Tax=Mercenaria mercenaria TaxID=6596 RepID=UPI00234E41E8|nr:uncharacterized protein LOC123526276 [Mercenaria mercenaria]